MPIQHPSRSVALHGTATGEIDQALTCTINKRFSNGSTEPEGTVLRITRLPDSGIWIVGSNDPDYIFGFKVSVSGSELEFKNPLNLWSSWAADYTAESVAELLCLKIIQNEKLSNPDPDSIYNLQDWLGTVMDRPFIKPCLVRIQKLPQLFRTISGIHESS